MQSHFVLWSSELCCSLLFTQWCFLLQLFSEDWKTPLNGILWVVHSNYPLLAKLLIEGIRSRAAPPSPGCDRRTGSSAAKSRVSDSESCFCHVRLWGFKCTAALACVCACAHKRERESSGGPDSGFPPALLQPTLASSGSSDVQETNSRVAFAFLSAECWVTQEGETKSLQSHQWLEGECLC